MVILATLKLSTFCPFYSVSASNPLHYNSATLNATWKYILLLVWQLFLRRQKWSTMVNTLVLGKWVSIQLFGKSYTGFPLLLLLSGGRNQRSHTFNRIATHINAAILSAICNRWSPLIANCWSSIAMLIALHWFSYSNVCNADSLGKKKNKKIQCCRQFCNCWAAQFYCLWLCCC